MTCAIEGCGKIIENRDNGLCATHNRLSRKPQPSKPKKKPIKKVSGGQIKKIRVYIQLRNAWIRDKECQVCGSPATDVHHTKGRLGILLLAVEWWLAVCRTCHKEIEENPEWAYEEGYSYSRLRKKICQPSVTSIQPI